MLADTLHTWVSTIWFFVCTTTESGKDWSRGFSKLLDAIANSFKIATFKKPYIKSQKQTINGELRRLLLKKEINRILDKISKSGYESLNEKEKGNPI